MLQIIANAKSSAELNIISGERRNKFWCFFFPPLHGGRTCGKKVVSNVITHSVADLPSADWSLRKVHVIASLTSS